MKGLCFDLIENRDPFSQKCKKCEKRGECSKEEVISDYDEDDFPLPTSISGIHSELEKTLFPLLETINSSFANLKANLEKTLSVYKTFHENQPQKYDNFFQLHLYQNIIDNYDRYLNKIVGRPQIDKLLDPRGKNKKITRKLINKNIQQHNNWIKLLRERYAKILRKDNYFSELGWIKNNKAIQKNLAKKSCQYLLQILDYLWSKHNREESIRLQSTYKIANYNNKGQHLFILICPDRTEVAKCIGISPSLVYKYLRAAANIGILKSIRKNNKNKMIYAIGYYAAQYSKENAFLTEKRFKHKLAVFTPY